MAIALVAGQVASAVGANPAAVLPNNPAVGNFVVAAVCTNGTADTITSVKDSNNNTYVATTKTPFTGVDTRVGIYYLANVPSGATKTVTVTMSSGVNNAVWVAEFSGVATTTPLETDATGNSSANGTHINSPSVTTTNDGDLLISVVGAGNTISTANSPWTGISTVQNGNYAEYMTQGTHGVQATDFTQGVSANWNGIIAAFTAAAAASFTYFPMTQPDMAGLLRKAEMVGY